MYDLDFWPISPKIESRDVGSVEYVCLFVSL